MFGCPQGLRPHQLPDARSDIKGRTVLRRIRSGYTVISSSRPQSPQPEPVAEIEEPRDEEQRPPTPPNYGASEQRDQERRPPTPPDYEAGEPPAYEPRLPSSPPVYTPSLDSTEEPVRDLKQALQRRRYRDALRRRITSTKSLFSGDRSSSDGGDPETTCDSESARGVVMYRQGDRWVGTTGAQGEAKVVPRQRGFKCWVRRTWNRLLDFSAEHPYLFILAVFVIVVVVLCLVI